ncbi:ATP synthase subunit C [Eggerthia catenaformis]|uniref:ATP synthase subunit C n=1 Tax=Eggerthia catenaformis TaxID=31973 RepID=UPI00248E6402|nr:ATP synthase subunit C [Eggerthia catenaformis]
MLTFILPAVVVIAFTLPLVKVFKGKVSKDSAKHRLALHVSGFFGAVALVLFMSLSSSPVFAAEASIAGTLAQGLGFIAAALATGMSALGAGIAVASAAPAAIGAFSENSENFGRSLIFVALGEGVAIYGLLISILIINAL